MNETLGSVHIKSDWLKNFIRERDGKFYVVQIITIVG